MATRRTARPKDNPAPVAFEMPGTLDQFEPYRVDIPLSQLRLSALNVRQTERDADIESLAEDIAARGLKQNLTVVPAHFTTFVSMNGETSAEGLFEVSGGGRRCQALQHLAALGRIDPGLPVSCLVEPRSEARETSLSENLHRVAMNPADEFEAYRLIVEERRTVHGDGEEQATAHCAKRFGVSARHVAERLRLAALSPTVMDALRTGEIGVDSAKAYATHADHDLQDKVFAAQAKSNWQPHAPRAVRDALRGLTVDLADIRVEYLGIDAYIAAGGRIETEMFMGDAAADRVVDVALLDKLVAEKAEAEVQRLVAEEGWQSGLFAKGTGYAVSSPKPPKDYFALSTWQDAPEGERRAQAIAVFRLGRSDLAEDAPDGARGDAVIEYYCAFLPIDKPAEGEDGEVATEQTRDYAAEREVRELEEKVQCWSARLALGSLAGTPLEGRTFWPNSHWRTVELKYADGVDEDDDGAEPVNALVQVWISVPADQLAQHREAAAAKVAEIEAKAAEERAAAQAAIDARRELEAGDEDGDDEQ